MALPVIEAPIYSMELPMSKQKIKIRPFLVKEEKMLLTAMAGKEPQEISDIIIQIIQNCTFEKVDVKSLPLLDLEYVLIRLRAYSKGEDFELNVKCKAVVDGKICNHLSTYTENINDIVVDTSKIINSSIKLSDTVGIKLQPPKANLIATLSKANQVSDVTANTLVECIESIWEGDVVNYAKDQSREDMETFVDQLTSPQLEEVKKYIDSLPNIEIVVAHKCEKCGNEETLRVRGLYDFLG